jgi:2-phosphosulfolactate phosphatase
VNASRNGTHAGVGDAPTAPPRAVVVIDVLRAFTTAAYAMSLGAERILLVGSVDQAIAVKALLGPRTLTLADGSARDDIDLVNSPALLKASPLAGRTLVMTTKNGTAAALAARTEGLLLCASFVNAAATANHLRKHARDVTFVASGGPSAEEDGACAEYLAALLHDPVADPAPFLARAAHAPARAVLDRRCAAGDSGVHADDVALCLDVDAAPVALVGTPHEYGIQLLR